MQRGNTGGGQGGDQVGAPDNPLFVPETGRVGGAEMAANGLLAYAQMNAIGFSPFAIESLNEGDSHAIGAAFQLVDRLSSLILSHQGDGTMGGARPVVAFDGSRDAAARSFKVGDLEVKILFEGQKDEDAGNYCGFFVQTRIDEFIVFGEGAKLAFSPARAGEFVVGLDQVWEQIPGGGGWIRQRLLNGDETHQGRLVLLPKGRLGVEQVKLYRYK